MTDDERLVRWQTRSELPLLLLAVAFLVGYAWPVLDPHLKPDIESVLQFTTWTVWGAFAADLAVRLTLASDRKRYAARHWYDFALLALPMLRPLRLLRLLAFAELINRSAVGTLAGRVFIYVSGAALSSVGLGTLAILNAERGAPGANITTAGDALWWSTTTVTTVGYGDYYPVTATGRFIAVGLMMVGIAVVGSLTAAIATWLISNVDVPREGAPGRGTRHVGRPGAQAVSARATRRSDSDD